MSQFVQISDFSTGRFVIPTNRDTEAILQEYIDNAENETIIYLLGKTMGELLIATPSLYPELTTPFIEDIDDEYYQSRGLKFILQGIIYFQYMRDQTIKATVTGSKGVNGELSTVYNMQSADYTTRYNNSITSYVAIQQKCLNDEVTYPDFNGQEKKYVLPI